MQENFISFTKIFAFGLGKSFFQKKNNYIVLDYSDIFFIFKSLYFFLKLFFGIF